MMSFLVTKFFQDLFILLGKAGVFWLFAVLCATGFAFIAAFVPETKGQSPYLTSADPFKHCFFILQGKVWKKSSVVSEEKGRQRWRQ
jgi:hypothetical protein